MRFRDHLLAAAAISLALYPRSPVRAALAILGGVALDIDHFLLYALRSGDWSPVGALRYDRRRHRLPRRGDTRPRYGMLRSVAHEPQVALPLIWLAATLWSPLRPLAVGLTVHLALDLHLPRFNWRVYRRAQDRCERCGIAGVPLEVYYLVDPRRGGRRWSVQNCALWCAECAREAQGKR
ncbi:MAG: hypothetical protein NZ699_12660 [Roseiflexus sp.]|nr:hypothetical protein [Roseiflexus sp.]MCS7289975.1 hypothetical protein [Roseiflexus sp.]MDW8147371.1 hypothetical protein [Roseiflexaceae bacterium]MDW8233329.1 hypothetical protein [Roseiflexaceae bacterium]